METKSTVTILYTSDVHGNAMPIVYGTNEKADLGLAKYATVVKNAKMHEKNLVIIDNGDLIQGTPFMTHYVKHRKDQINPMIDIMNTLELDAAVLGNHEFNFGQAILTDAVRTAQFPFLSANTIDTHTNAPLFGKPYIIKQFENGVKAAIVGVTTHFIPNWESPEHLEGIHFTDAYETLQTWVTHIHQNEAPDIVIAAYHGGFERDIETGNETERQTGENQAYRMCQDIDGIDVLLTGHQHRTLTGVVNGVTVIQPGSNGVYYGEVTIHLEKDANGWAIHEKHANIHSLDGVPADQHIIKRIQPSEAATQTWLDEPVGYVEGDMTISDPFQARISKHPFIELIQKIQMDAANVDISVTALLSNESRGFSNNVTMRDIVSNYIYPNTFVVLSLTGTDIKAALEKSATYFTRDENGTLCVNPEFMEPKPQHYNYDMWEGIDYVINVSKPVGSRIESITYHGHPLERDQHYHVVLNNYRAGGGGNYDMFKDKPIVKDIQRDAVELIQRYFETHKTIQAQCTDNFKVVT
ncbi:bifunctional metallophosphatase/5'-nucleotidase [Lentibacillus saliphilus]|uniref:bifunctional metallophosphatase/5'-nucleotidase n=1 Tax=Lentibacillus saliphilus TaxID=2737028 RepID=UPI001C2FEA35|nr:bifunctional UDP-sugar hydrolase/5'-nucleotidase [Lentibacillus saliphilus]